MPLYLWQPYWKLLTFSEWLIAQFKWWYIEDFFSCYESFSNCLQHLNTLKFWLKTLKLNLTQTAQVLQFLFQMLVSLKLLYFLSPDRFINPISRINTKIRLLFADNFRSCFPAALLHQNVYPAVINRWFVSQLVLYFCGTWPRPPPPLHLSAKKRSTIKNYLKHGTHSHLRSGSKRWNEDEELNPYLNVIRTFGSFHRGC